MFAVNIDIEGLAQSLTSKIEDLDYGRLTREIAFGVKDKMQKRIHVEGKNSKGQEIGKYSDGYMVVRTGNYKNKGSKNAGFYTKGKNAIYDIRSRKAVKVAKKSSGSGHSMREVYNRNSNRKVILSLTREMENDYQVVPLTAKSYGIGFGNRHNFDKMKWNNKRYGTPIFAMSEEEKKVMRDVIQRHVNSVK